MFSTRTEEIRVKNPVQTKRQLWNGSGTISSGNACVTVVGALMLGVNGSGKDVRVKTLFRPGVSVSVDALESFSSGNACVTADDWCEWYRYTCKSLEFSLSYDLIAFMKLV